MAETYPAMDPSGDSASGGGPWDDDVPPPPAGISPDPLHQQALKGYGIGVSLPPGHPNHIDPDDGLARLKKLGAVPAQAQVSDVLPVARSLAQGGAGSQPPTGGQPPQPGSSQFNGPLPLTAQTQGKSPLAMGGQPQASQGMAVMGQPLVVPLSANKDVANDSNKWQTTSVMNQLPPWDTLKAKQLVASGIKPGVAQDDQGQDEYEQKRDAIGRPLFTDSQGNPTNAAMDPNGKPNQPVYDQNRPKYDFSRNEADPSSPVQQQLSGIGRLQGLMGIGANIQAKSPMIAQLNMRPLAALTDAWSKNTAQPSDFSKNYEDPETFQQSQDTFSKYAQGLQKDRSDIQKGIYENMKTMGGGSITDLLNMQNANTVSQNLQETLNKGGQQQLQAQQRADQIAYRQMLQRLSTNPVLKSQLSGLFSIENSQGIMSGNELNKNSFTEAQNLSRIGSQVGANVRTTGNEREGTYMQDISKQIGAFLDNYVQGGNLKIPKNDPQVQHFIGLNNELLGMTQKYKDQYLSALTSGNDRIFHRGTPESDAMMSDFKQAVGAYRAVGGTPAPAKAKGLNLSSGGSNGKPQMIRVKNASGQTGTYKLASGAKLPAGYTQVTDGQ